MLWPVLISGFTLGAAGSLHCVGMCGPLSLALPVQHLGRVSRFIYLLLYQLGRVITYASLGLLFGLAGRSIYLAGIQQQFSILLGIVILWLAVLYGLRKTSLHLSFLSGFYLFIQRLTGRLLRQARGPLGFLLLGMANGFLPCGLVYIAVAGALSASEVFGAMGFMAMFGLGTLPAMLFVAYMGQAIGITTRRTLRKAVPVFITLMAVVLILRGLNLDIPFISPGLPAKSGGTVIECHN